MCSWSAPGASKTISLVVDQNGEPVAESLTITSSEHLQDVLEDYGGSLVGVMGLAQGGRLTSIESIEELTQGGTYTIVGGWSGMHLGVEWEQQALQRLRGAAALAVQAACEPAMGRLSLRLGTQLREWHFESLLISGARALIAVEARPVAAMPHIGAMLSRADCLLQHASQGGNGPFSGVSEVLPVLAASHFPEDMLALCGRLGIGAVMPTGAGHTYIPSSRPPRTAFAGRRALHTMPGQRSLHTLARVLHVLLH
jgi:hypothetical protein